MELFNIETIKDSNNNEVSFCPERGGIITSLKFQEKEILYLDKETFVDLKRSVRGGIPILFPNAGVLNKETNFPKLLRHGFARDSVWQEVKETGFFRENLVSNINTEDKYPFNFNISVSGKFESDGSFTLTEEVTNNEIERSLPLSMGLHPYFYVPDNEKDNIEFIFSGGGEVKDKSEIWKNEGTVIVDNPKTIDKDAVVEVFIPAVGYLLLDISPEFNKIWFWSVPGKDFICIEPMMRGEGGLDINPEMISPKNTFSASLKIKIKI